MSFINSKNLDMGEEENRDVVVEGGTVISYSSIVVKQCKLKEGANGCKLLSTVPRLSWQIDVYPCHIIR